MTGSHGEQSSFRGPHTFLAGTSAWHASRAPNAPVLLRYADFPHVQPTAFRTSNLFSPLQHKDFIALTDTTSSDVRTTLDIRHGATERASSARQPRSAPSCGRSNATRTTTTRRTSGASRVSARTLRARPSGAGRRVYPRSTNGKPWRSNTPS